MILRICLAFNFELCNICQHEFSGNNFATEFGHISSIGIWLVFMVNWMDSIIESIWFSGVVRRECIRFLYILSPGR